MALNNIAISAFPNPKTIIGDGDGEYSTILGEEK